MPRPTDSLVVPPLLLPSGGLFLPICLLPVLDALGTQS
jgi:hypothetical protein